MKNEMIMFTGIKGDEWPKLRVGINNGKPRWGAGSKSTVSLGRPCGRSRANEARKCMWVFQATSLHGGGDGGGVPEQRSGHLLPPWSSGKIGHHALWTSWLLSRALIVFWMDSKKLSFRNKLLRFSYLLSNMYGVLCRILKWTRLSLWVD